MKSTMKNSGILTAVAIPKAINLWLYPVTCPFSRLQVHIRGVASTIPKNRRFVKKRKRKKALIFFPQQRFSDLKRSVEVPIDISAGTQKIPGG